MSQDYTLDSAIDHYRLKQNQLSRSLFEKWFNENKLDDEYFTRHEMYWFAEQAWLAATIIQQNPITARIFGRDGEETNENKTNENKR